MGKRQRQYRSRFWGIIRTYYSLVLDFLFTVIRHLLDGSSSGVASEGGHEAGCPLLRMTDAVPGHLRRVMGTAEET